MPTQDQIRGLAYSLWEQEGRPDGKDLDHYYAAVRILQQREVTKIAQPLPLPLPPRTPVKPASRGFHGKC